MERDVTAFQRIDRLLSVSYAALLGAGAVLFWRDALDGAQLDALIAGTADRPFVTRQLIPLLVGALAPDPAYYWPLAAGLVVAFMLGYGALVARLTRTPCLALTSTVLLFLRGGFPYDAATLFFAALVLALVRGRRWGWLLLVFPLACLNRETTLLFIVPLVLYHGRAGWPVAAGLVGQWALVRGALALAYAANPGAAFEWHGHEHLWLWEQSPLGFVVITGVPPLVLVAAYAGWRRFDRWLRACAPLPLVLYALFVLFGYPLEWRVFAEVHVVLFLMIERSLGVAPVHPRSISPPSLVRAGETQTTSGRAQHPGDDDA